jgi:hypothetical protein
MVKSEEKNIMNARFGGLANGGSSLCVVDGLV